jgi:hypothetical protein
MQQAPLDGAPKRVEKSMKKDGQAAPAFSRAGLSLEAPCIAIGAPDILIAIRAVAGLATKVNTLYSRHGVRVKAATNSHT